MRRSVQGFMVLLLTGTTFGAKPAGVFKVDAVELVRGKEIAGQPSISTDHYRFRYLFANEANKAEFLAHPEKYEIQFGGACGRMGALSGLGKPDLFTVYNKHIYIFGSEARRSDFLANPERVLDRPDPVAFGSDDAKKQGRALIERVVESMGGASRVDAVRNYQRRLVRKSNWQGKNHVVVDALTIEFPNRVRSDHQWDARHESKVLTDRDAWEESDDGVFTLHPQQREAMHKQYIGRNLMAMVQARNRRDFIAVHDGAQTIEYDGKPVEIQRVIVTFGDATSTLGIDAKTGRILTQTYRGRGARAVFGTVERIFTNFQTINGITYPKSSRVRFNGKELAPIDEKGMTLAFNKTLPLILFRRPNK